MATPISRPHALKLGDDSIDVVSGRRFDPDTLTADPQNYLVIPDQPWLDGSSRATASCASSWRRRSGRGHRGVAITLSLFRRGPDACLVLHTPRSETIERAGEILDRVDREPPLGLDANGRVRQRIYADEWRDRTSGTRSRSGRPYRPLVDAVAFEAVTGIAAPPPVDGGHPDRGASSPDLPQLARRAPRLGAFGPRPQSPEPWQGAGLGDAAADAARPPARADGVAG
jgi:hypothetical protein